MLLEKFPAIYYPLMFLCFYGFLFPILDALSDQWKTLKHSPILSLEWKKRFSNPRLHYLTFSVALFFTVSVLTAKNWDYFFGHSPLECLPIDKRPARTVCLINKKNRKESVYKEVYAVGVRNETKDYKTLRNVQLKAWFASSEPWNYKVLGTTNTKTDISPGETAFFEIGYFYSYMPRSLGNLKNVFTNDDFFELKVLADNETFVFSMGDQSTSPISKHLRELRKEELKKSRKPYLYVYGKFIADDTPPRRVKISVLHDDEFGIAFGASDIED